VESLGTTLKLDGVVARSVVVTACDSLYKSALCFLEIAKRVAIIKLVAKIRKITLFMKDNSKPK
jgi:hypothetical protein